MFLKLILELIFGKKPQAPAAAAAPTAPAPESRKEPEGTAVDWSDPLCKISKHFTVKDACWLPRWKRLATLEDGLDDDAKEALARLFNDIMDPTWEALRDAGAKSKNVHVAFRSVEYNKLIGGATLSAHTARKDAKWGLMAAVDFSVDFGLGSAGKNCDRTRALLLPKLNSLKARMEDNGIGSTWVHVDSRGRGPGGAFFKP